MMVVTLRTLDRWQAEPPKKAGRPGHTEAEYRAALRPVREALGKMGWKAGAEAVCRWLGLRLPLRVVRVVLKRWKSRHETRRKRRLAQQRLTVAVARRVGPLYNHLQLRKGSPLSRLQREMVAVVVNGHLSGAP